MPFASSQLPIEAKLPQHIQDLDKKHQGGVTIDQNLAI